jgi:hypothetical protein
MSFTVALPPDSGGYRFVRFIGRGQFGDVFEAVGPDAGSVAVKRLHWPVDHL